MKSLRRQCGKVLFAVVALGTLAQAAPTLANTHTRVRVLQDKEPNDIQANAGSLASQYTLAISGKLSTFQDTDNFAWIVNGPARSMTLRPSNNPAGISYILLEDRNGNGRRDTNDPIIAKGRTNPIRVELKGRRRFLMQVYGSRGTAASAYGFRVSASNAAPMPPRPKPPCTNCHQK